MDINKKSIKGISPTGKLLIGALLVGGAIWAWIYFKKKSETPVQTQPVTPPSPVLTLVNTLPPEDTTTPVSDEQAKADAIAKYYVYGRMSGLPESKAKNDSIVSQLATMGYKVSCITTPTDAYICKAVKI